MNKVHWNDLYLEKLNDDMVKELIDHSYCLVLQKLPKRLREKYEING